MKTLVIGASHKPDRYSFLAVNMLREYNHETVALGRRAREVDDWQIIDGRPALQDIHTVTLYLNPSNQREYYEYIISLEPQRVIFNPGTENAELRQKLLAAGIEPVSGCTLVMLRSGLY